MKIDFVCVGFPKCGTTTLDSVLRQHTKLRFPEVKEIGFFGWYKAYVDPIKELKNYYPDTEGKIVGGIEPTFFKYASEVKEYYGEDAKIIFMMRNPVDRLFSDFRMKIRNGSEGFKYFYKEYKANQVSEMFDRYVKEKLGLEKYDDRVSNRTANLLHRSDYTKWIKEYQQQYKPENIMYIWFEEYINDPQKVLEEVQAFIGVEPEELNYNIRENGGKQISKNYLCAHINKWCYKRFLFFLNRKRMPYSVKKKLRKVNQGLWRFVGKFTLIDNSEKMSKEARELLQNYYRDSVKELEAVTGTDLSKIWYE